MTKLQEHTECTCCGAEIGEDSDTDGKRNPCKICGSTKRIYNISITEKAIMRDGYGISVRSPGKKRSHIEEKSIPDYSYSRGKKVHRQQLFHRGNDKYFERITDYETGEIIHQCEEALSKHRGHGNAKRNKESG
ncbi:MAG: hypothetical protein K9L59_09230 [Desulfobacterales bacterium]|nr:hypothetical protein [Desulfobacterales bacterium]MCF8080891.1 hypothetical protein [Desulfobacterales bacterium]